MGKIKENKIFFVVVGIIVFLFVGFFIGKNYNDAVQLTSTLQATTTESVTQPERKLDMEQPLVTTKVTPTQNSNLKKKMECSVYRKQIEDELFEGLVKSNIVGVLYQVFYSASLDTCLSAKYIIYPAGSNFNGTSNESETLTINDILNGKIIWSQIYEPALEYSVAQAKLDMQIAVLY